MQLQISLACRTVTSEDFSFPAANYIRLCSGPCQGTEWMPYLVSKRTPTHPGREWNFYFSSAKLCLSTAALKLRRWFFVNTHFSFVQETDPGPGQLMSLLHVNDRTRFPRLYKWWHSTSIRWQAYDSWLDGRNARSRRRNFGDHRTENHSRLEKCLWLPVVKRKRRWSLGEDGYTPPIGRYPATHTIHKSHARYRYCMKIIWTGTAFVGSDPNPVWHKHRSDLYNFAMVDSDLFDKKSVKFKKNCALEWIISSLILNGAVHTSIGKSCCSPLFCHFLHSA